MEVQENRKRVNGFVLVITTVIYIFLLAGLISDYKAGHNSQAFMLTVEATVFVSLAANYIIYLKNRESRYFRIIAIIGYMAAYALAVFGSQSDVVYVMAFPLPVTYILYYNYKLILAVAIVFGMINLADVAGVVFLLKHMHSGAPLNSVSLLLQVAAVTVFMVVLCGTTLISGRNNDERIQGLNAQKEKSAEMLEEVLKIAEAVRESSIQASSQLDKLSIGVSVMASISDRANMPAPNASVESARAGGEGKD